MSKAVDISPEVAKVLRASVWRGWLLELPDEPLERSLYLAVKKVLEVLGAKWHRGHKGFMFSLDGKEALNAALAAGHVFDQKRTLEQFFTPTNLADRMADLAQIGPGAEVLEPSAGSGRLVARALDRGANVTAIELDPQLARGLIDEFSGRAHTGRLEIIPGDFLALPALSITPDVVLMNPPFSRNQDIAHVRHAFDCLRPGGRLVAIMSPHFTFANDAPSREFRALIGYEAPGGRQDDRYLCGGDGSVEECVVEILPAGAFKAEGTNIAALLVTIDKAGRA